MKPQLFFHFSRSFFTLACCFGLLSAPFTRAEQPIATATSALLANSSLAASTDEEPIFLAVDDAFKLNIDNTQNGISLIWQIAPDYYLYKHKFKLTILPSAQHQPFEKVDLTATAAFSKGLRKSDDYYGQVEVYYHQAIAELSTKQLAASNAKQLEISYQGCAEAGLCYPIQTRIIELP